MAETIANKEETVVFAPYSTEDHSKTLLLPNPYFVRAIALDSEHSGGTPAGYENNNQILLQQHVAFFDQDGNGIVYPWETYAGLRAIGLNFVLALILAIFFNLAFSFQTINPAGWFRFPSLLLPIYIRNIHRSKYGSDSGAYDKEGIFVPVNLEIIFSKYAKKVADKLTLRELLNMSEANRVSYDFFGWIVSKVKWVLFYYVARDEQGFVAKETVRGLYDGSLFEYLAKKHSGGG